MKTEHKFAVTLKNMMSEKSLDEISVLSICKKCKVNRQTFYYHFHDIYDLLTLIFLDEKVEGIDKTTNFTEMITCIYKYYEDNKNFIEATVNSAGKDLFQEFVYNLCYQSTMRYIGEYEISKNITNNQKKNVARFYASAFSNCIIYYIGNYKRKTLDGLLNSFDFIDQLELSKTLQNIVKKA